MDQIKSLIIQIEKLKADQQYSTAEQLVESSIIKYHGDYRLYEELSDICLFKGEISKALKAVNFALELNKESATGNYLKGFLLLSKDKIPEAIPYLEISNRQAGNNPEVLRNLGWAYAMNGNTDKGIFLLRRALIIAPDDELITEDLAMALIGIGEVSEGNALLKKIGKNNIC